MTSRKRTSLSGCNSRFCPVPARARAFSSHPAPAGDKAGNSSPDFVQGRVASRPWWRGFFFLGAPRWRGA